MLVYKQLLTSTSHRPRNCGVILIGVCEGVGPSSEQPYRQPGTTPHDVFFVNSNLEVVSEQH